VPAYGFAALHSTVDFCNNFASATTKCVMAFDGRWTEVDERDNGDERQIGQIAGLQFDCAAVERFSLAMGLPISR
jgi:hypothetical protein